MTHPIGEYDASVASHDSFTPGAEMLAEIFFLKLEATLRANNERSTHAPKFVPFNWAEVPGFKKPRATVPRHEKSQ